MQEAAPQSARSSWMLHTGEATFSSLDFDLAEVGTLLFHERAILD
jgi:hypothetical protein